jgi:hypothetical protein
MKRTIYLWNIPLKNGGEEIILHEITRNSDGTVSGFINHRWTFDAGEI